MLAIALAAGFFFSGTSSAAPAQPIAVKSATSGPVRLSLSVLNPKLRAGEMIYFLVDVKNVSRKEFLLADEVFLTPAMLAEASNLKIGTYLEMKAPDGEPPANYPGDHVQVEEATGEEARETREPEALGLKPGRTASVLCAGIKRKSGRREWCPLGFWHLGEPGTYKIRAVYDVRPVKGRARPEAVKVATPWISVQVTP